ncbi:MAG: hypothetical protein HY359_10225 [Candidatus Rokubacteria bacterium]|nr:hypothetical protein [Candidatus Rokubacteria bacterium]
MGKVLTPQQVERYERAGVLFPVPALSPDETARYLAAFELLPAPPALTLDEAVAAQQAAAARLVGSLRQTTGHHAADEPR